MKTLLAWLNAEIKEALSTASGPAVYTRFEKIHPSWTATAAWERILLNAILNRFKYMPVIFFTENTNPCEAPAPGAIEGRPKNSTSTSWSRWKKPTSSLREKSVEII